MDATDVQIGRPEESFSRARRIGFIVACGLLVLVAFVGGWGAVAGLRWPGDPDLLRNIAGGVAFRDGHPLRDPYLSGAPNWYSPLTGVLLGAGSTITGWPVNRVGTQGGAVLNLVPPLALCWVTARWFGRAAALGTLVAFLFVMGADYPSWAVVAYSPWMFVPIYSLGLFVLALALVPAAVTGGSNAAAVLLGVVVGVLALAHPAAVMVLAPVVAVQFVRAALQGSHMTRRRLLGVAGISISSALIVSAPFWLPVVVRYHGHVANRAPGDFVWPPLASGREATTPGSPYGGTNATNILQFLKEFFWRWPMLVIAVGLSLWIAGRIGRKRKVTPSSPTATLGAPRSIGCDAVWIVTTWTIWSFVGLLMASYRVVSFPFPSYHFLFYLSAALCIWFGVSLYVTVRASFALAERILQRYRRTIAVEWQQGRLYKRWGAVAVAALVAGIAILTFPGWHGREDLVGHRNLSRIVQYGSDSFAAVRWIRANTKPDDVFLNTERGPAFVGPLVHFFPGLAGRHSVNIESQTFSNPFVDWQKRHHDAQQMLRALEACQAAQFEKLVAHYGRVRYVLLPSSAPNAGSSFAPACSNAAPVVYRHGGVIIHRIDWPLAVQSRDPARSPASTVATLR